MLKRLFGIGKKAQPAHRESPTPGEPVGSTRRAGAQVDEPVTPYDNYFSVHVYGISPETLIPLIREHYLHHVAEGTEAVVLLQAGAWVTLSFPETVVKGLGFNRIASQIAQALDTWVIGYRIFAGQGMDVHYFEGTTHVDQLAMSGNEIEYEPEEASRFATVADVGAVVPRRDAQHPLDFHVALLEALGIGNAAVTWEEAVKRGGRVVTA